MTRMFSLLDVVHNGGDTYAKELWEYRDKLKLMRYTGHSDKEGTDLYEGDIVQLYPLKKKEYRVVKVRPFGWEFENFKKDDEHNHYLSSELFKIVGNVYQNPELLV